MAPKKFKQDLPILEYGVSLENEIYKVPSVIPILIFENYIRFK